MTFWLTPSGEVIRDDGVVVEVKSLSAFVNRFKHLK